MKRLDKIDNAKIYPQIFYGLHMCEGVAQYQEPGKDPYRIFINESTLKEMDPTFAGKPIYVRHVDEVDLDNLQNEADGYVIESFFNKCDGKHWVKFIVVSDKGHEAVNVKKWQLSNSYLPKELKQGGLWHGVDYAKEIVRGEYEHLAIVPNPRYEESIILTPEEFKQYNLDKEIELKKLSNAKEKGETKMKLNFFKKSKVENSADFEGMSVTLPKSQKEMSIVELVTEMDKIQNMHGYANDEHMVKVGEGEMSVKDLVAKHQAMCQELEEMKKKKVDDASDEESKEKKHDDDDAADESDDESKEKHDDAADEPEMKKKNLDKDEDKDAKKKALELAEHEDKEIKEKKEDDDADEPEMKKKNANFDKLKNAPLANLDNEEIVYKGLQEQVETGRARYGSGN